MIPPLASAAAATASTTTMRSLFVYGTLMAPEVMQCLVGRVPPCTPAVLHGYTRHPVVGFCFPGIITAAEGKSVVHGLLYTDLTRDELALMDWFEDEEYTRTNVVVETTATTTADDPKATTTSQSTQVYVWTNPLNELNVEVSWDYSRFRQQHFSDYLVNTVERYRDEFEREQQKQQEP